MFKILGARREKFLKLRLWRAAPKNLGCGAKSQKNLEFGPLMKKIIPTPLTYEKTLRLILMRPRTDGDIKYVKQSPQLLNPN